MIDLANVSVKQVFHGYDSFLSLSLDALLWDSCYN